MEFYPDALDALRRVAARLPVVALSNGNADLSRIGIAALFAFQLSALVHGVPKPEPGIFLAACARLDLAPHAVLHAGDDVTLDMHGAARAGRRGCWINRTGAAWPDGEPRPALEFATLTGLADWLDTQSARAAAA